MKTRKTIIKNRITVTGIVLCGLISSIGLSNYYKVGIMNKIESYPFGKEEFGFLPYFYKTPALFSMVNLIWGLIFLCVFLLGIWNVETKKINQNIIIGLMYGFLFLQMVHNILARFI